LRPGQLPNIVSRWLREKEFIFEMTVHLRLTPSEACEDWISLWRQQNVPEDQIFRNRCVASNTDTARATASPSVCCIKARERISMLSGKCGFN